MSFFYSEATDKAYSAYQMLSLFGYDTATTYIEVLNDNGFYPVIESLPDFDINLYNAVPDYTVVGQFANKIWIETPKDLATAKTNGESELKRKSSLKVDDIVSDSGFSSNLFNSLTSVTGTVYEGTVNSINLASIQLNSDLNVYLPAATTVDEVNDVVNPPTGLINIGRGATGAEDLNVTTFTSFTSYTLPESGTELFVTGTGTLISYSGSGFPATVGAFNPGDYEIELRQVSTGRIIARFDVPLNAANEDVAF